MGLKETDKLLVVAIVVFCGVLLFLFVHRSAKLPPRTTHRNAPLGEAPQGKQTQTPVPATIESGPNRPTNATHVPPADASGRSDPNISQSVIDSTICVPGFSEGIRPSRTLMEKLKRQLLEETNAPGTASDYELDHVIPLELGGCTYCKENLWLQPIADAKKKDIVENYLHRQVCSGSLSLVDAQQEIATDWYSVYKRISPSP